MSISTTATKVSYAGNNSNSTPYAITFKYLDVSHVTVYADKVDITTNCTFSGDGAAGTGQFTTDAAQAPTVTVAAVLDVPFDQPVVLQETGSLPAKTLEVSGFDRLNMQIRRVWRKATDALSFSSDEGSGSTGTANTLVGFDGSGDIAEIPNGTFCQTANNLSDVDAATARANLNVDVAGTDNSTDVTTSGTGTYVSIGAGQVLTVDPITESDIADLGAYITDITGENLTNLSDVTITTPSTGQVLSWNGSAWVNTAAGNGDMLTATYDPSGNAAAIGTTQGVGATTYNIQASDEGTVAGNARGENSVDLQTDRAAATQVASGSGAVLLGGLNNSATQVRSTVINGTGNTSSGNNAVVSGGYSNEAIGNQCGVYSGNDNSAAGEQSVVLGGNNNTASGNKSAILGGRGNATSNDETIVMGGEAGTASHIGSRVFPDSTTTAFSSIANDEFAIQASALRLVDGNEGAGKVLTSDANGSGNWVAPSVFLPSNYGATGDGVADDTTELQACIDAAEATSTPSGLETNVASHPVVDLEGKVYKITDTLTVDNSLVIQNGTIIATAAMTGGLNYMLDINADFATLQNLFLDGGDNGSVCYANLINIDGTYVKIFNVHGTHFPDAGVNLTGDASMIESSAFYQWIYADGGAYTDETARSAKALKINFASTGNRSSNSFFGNSENGLWCESAGNIFTNCKFVLVDDTTSPTIEPDVVFLDGVTGSGVALNIFNGCAFESGIVRINGNNDADFRKVFNACSFTAYATNNHNDFIIIDSTATNTAVDGLIVSGCSFVDFKGINYITFEGSGTFLDDIDKKIQWVGNIDADGSPAWHNATFGGGAMFTGNGALAIKDGITAPATVTGAAVIYVDTADGDLKVKFGDGTVKTIATDT